MQIVLRRWNLSRLFENGRARAWMVVVGMLGLLAFSAREAEALFQREGQSPDRPAVSALARRGRPSAKIKGPSPKNPIRVPEGRRAQLKAESVPGEVLVKFKKGAMSQGESSIHAEVGAQVLSRIREVNVQRVRGTRGQSTEALIHEYSKRPDVEYVEPNGIFRIQVTPNDPGYPKLWGLHNVGQTQGSPDADIDAPEAWDRQTGSALVIVAGIDSGIDYTHPDLVDNVWANPGEIAGNGIDDDGNGFIDDLHGWDFFNNDSDPMDDHGHGTHTAGTIAAIGNNGVGVVGVSWRAKVMALKFLNASGEGNFAGAAQSILYASRMGARVANASFGCGPSPFCFSRTIRDALEVAHQRGMLFVASAGNESNDNDVTPAYPCNDRVPNVLCVAAADHIDQMADFSNFGVKSVDLAAPGVNIYSTVPTGECGLCDPSGYLALDGTSMAAPHVSGAAALLAAQFPGLTVDQLKGLLTAVDPVPSLSARTLTGGRLNVDRAIRSAFTLVGSPSQRGVQSGQSAVFTLTAASMNGAGGSAALSFSTPDPGITGSISPNPLAFSPNGSANATLTVTTGATTPAGVYELVVRGRDDRGETHLISVFLLVGTDLAMTFVEGPPSGETGKEAPLSYTVVNRGEKSTGGFYVGLYLSEDRTITAGDFRIGSQWINGLAAGESRSGAVAGWIAARVPPGNYFVGAIADDSEQIVDIDRGNNALAGGTLTVHAVPPFPVTSPDWAVLLEGPPGQHAFPGTAATDLSGNVYVTGTIEEDYVTVKYDPAGNLLWTARLDLGIDSASAVVVDPVGNVYVTGSSCSLGDPVVPNDCRAYQFSYTVIKYDPDGNPLWVAHGGGTDPTDIEVDPSGHVYVTGCFCAFGQMSGSTIKISPGGEVLWENGDSGLTFDVAVDAAGNVYTAGTNCEFCFWDYTVRKYDPNGALLWTARYDGAGNDDIGNTLAVDRSGNVYVTGGSCKDLSCSDFDFATVKYDSEGRQLWAVRYDNGEEDFASALKLDAAGNVYVAGRSFNGGDHDFALFKYGPAGNLAWSARYDGGKDEFFSDMVIDPAGNVYLAGGTFEAGSGFLIVKYGPDGALLMVAQYDSGEEEGLPVISVDPSGNLYANSYRFDAEGFDILTVKFGSPFPDLLINSVSGPTAAAAGSQISLSDAVKNQGSRSASSFSVGFYLSLDRTITSFDLFLGSRPVGSLVAGAGSAGTTAVTIPSGVAPGTYYFGAISDHDGRLVEGNEGNNALSGNPIVIGSGGETVFFQDDFNRTTGLGPSWRVTAGSFSTDGNFAVSSGAASWAAITKTLSSNDYTVESTLIIPAGSLYSGIVARGNPAAFSSDLYSVQLSTQGTVNLYRRNASTWTLLKSLPSGIAANQPYTIKLKVSGSNPVILDVSLNGGSLFSYQDSAPSRILTGIPGIENYNSGVKYDRFAVRSIGGGDGTPPSIPASLTAPTVTIARVDLSWSASTDNVGVAGYKIFRNGSQIGTSAGTGFFDSAVAINTTYTYAVSAFDAAGNESARSLPLTVKTASLQSIAITPANPILVTGENLQFVAMGAYTDGSSRDLTAEAKWASSNIDVAVVFSGNAHGRGPGVATITATDRTGNVIGSTTLTVKEPPVVRLSANPTAGRSPLVVHFDASGSSDPDGTIVSYAWSFGDGTVGAGAVIDHTYSAVGRYKVIVTVTNNEGASASNETEVLVCSAAEFCDAFGQADRTGLGSDWTVAAGDFIIWNRELNNHARFESAAIFRQAIGPDQSVAVDCSVFAFYDDLKENCGVMARWSSEADFYQAWIDPNHDKVVLSKTAGGASAILASQDHPLEMMQYHRIRLVVSGSTISVFVDDEKNPVIATTDSSVTTGDFAGIRAFDECCSDGIWFDNFIAGPAPRAVSQSDDFNRANSSNLGSGWNEVLPNLEIFSNQLRNVDAGSKAAIWSQAIGADQEVAVDCMMTATGNSCGVMGRWADANNFYRARIDAGAKNITLFKTVNGTTTQLGTAARTIAFNTYYRVRLVIKGSALQVYFGNETTPAVSATDSALTSGTFVGIRSSSSAAATTWFDNFSASSGGAPPVNQPPVARLSANPASGTAPLAVHFDGSTSSDPDGSIVSHAWSFGDGAIGSGSIADHTYSAAGTYTATLTVTDNNGATGSSSIAMTVTSPASSVLFEDPFNRTTGLGANWKITAGTYSTDGNYAVSSGTANWAQLMKTLPGSDYTVESVLIVPAGSLYSGLVARGNPSAFSSDLYSAQIATNGTVNLYRRNAGTWTQLKSANGGIVANQAYTLKLKVTGSNPVNLEVSLNGSLLLSYQDSAANRILSGVPGIENYNSGVKYDRFTVTGP